MIHFAGLAAESDAMTRASPCWAQKMLDWRLRHADRTLTGYAATPEGLTSRN